MGGTSQGNFAGVYVPANKIQACHMIFFDYMVLKGVLALRTHCKSSLQLALSDASITMLQLSLSTTESGATLLFAAPPATWLSCAAVRFFSLSFLSVSFLCIASFLTFPVVLECSTCKSKSKQGAIPLAVEFHLIGKA